MDAQRIAIARKCLNAAHDGSMKFPETVGALIQSGFEGYTLDFRRRSATYFLPHGDHVTFDDLPGGGAIGAGFDAAAIAAQVAWAQKAPPDYDFGVFCRNIMTAGCSSYTVDFPGRRVVYYGERGAQHVEWFPGAK